MTQLFKVLINGIDSTTNIPSCNVSIEINRLYDTATFPIDIKLQPNDNIAIDAGDIHFDGFVYAITKTQNNTYSIECRSNTAKLTDPFINSDKYEVIDVHTSNALYAYYMAKYGVTINNSAIELNFSGDFEQQGTVLNAIATLANVTGAEYYTENGDIFITPNKAITTHDYELADSDIFSFIPYAKTIYQKGVGVVEVGVRNDPTTLTTTVSCTAEVDQCSGEAIVRIIPHDSYDSARGITLIEINTPLHHESVIPPTTHMTLEAHISSIESIYVGGAEITDYTFKYDTIVFLTEKRGIIQVNYHGYGYRGYVNILEVSLSRYAEFDIFYGACEVYRFQEVMTCGDDGLVSNCGGIVTLMPKNRNYVSGFSFETIGSSPSFAFLLDDREVSVNVISSAISGGWVESAVLSILPDQSITHELRFAPISITEIRSKGTVINAANYSIVGKVITFDQVYLGVTISYLIDMMTHEVKFANYPDDNVSMIVSGNVQGECSFRLEGFNQDSNSSLVCAEGVTATVNIAEELGIKPYKALGVYLNVTDPNGTVVVRQVDNFGLLKIPNVVFGTYTINTTALVGNSKINLTVGGQ